MEYFYDPGEYATAEYARKAIEIKNRWMIYSCLVSFSENISEIITDLSTDISITVDSNKTSQGLVKVEDRQLELQHQMETVYNSVEENVINWCKIRDEYGLVQVTKHLEEFGTEVTRYIKDAYDDFLRTDRLVHTSLKKKKQYKNISTERELEYLKNADISAKYTGPWYPPTIVDLLENHKKYHQYVERDQSGFLNNCKIGLSALRTSIKTKTLSSTLSALASLALVLCGERDYNDNKDDIDEWYISYMHPSGGTKYAPHEDGNDRISSTKLGVGLNLETYR